MFGFDLLFWHWWIAAVILLTVELLMPGFFFLWMAFAAFVTGSLFLLIPILGEEMQILLFSVMSIASIVVWHKYFKQQPTQSDHPYLNKRGSKYIGRVFTLQEAIINGTGKIHLDGSIWQISGEDSQVGDQVEVVSLQGTELIVKKLPK